MQWVVRHIVLLDVFPDPLATPTRQRAELQHLITPVPFQHTQVFSRPRLAAPQAGDPHFHVTQHRLQRLNLANLAAQIRIVFPELTAERRALLMKLVGEKLEQARVALRGHRTDALHSLDEDEKGGGMGKDEHERLKKEVQKITDAGTAKLEEFAKKKETELAS